MLETERLRSLVRRLKFKTLGDFHDLEFTQIKNTKHIGGKTFSEFQELIEKTKNGGFDDYLCQNQSNSFKTKLLSKLNHRICIPDEIKNVEVKFVSFTSKLLLRSVKRDKTVTFETLCEEFGTEYESETAHKLWRTLRSSDKLRFDPVYKSRETKIIYAGW